MNIDKNTPIWAQEEEKESLPEEGVVFLLPPEKLAPSADQPRQEFDEETVAQLAANMEHLHKEGRGFRGTGVIQPLSIKYPQGVFDRAGMAKLPDTPYVINAGETRWRAAQKANLPFLPVYIEDVNEDEAYELAYFENSHRKDISPIEEAIALNRIKKVHGFSIPQLAKYVNKTNAFVEARLRIVDYPEDVLELLAQRPTSIWYAQRISAIKSKRTRERLIKMVFDGKPQIYVQKQVKYYRDKERAEREKKKVTQSKSTFIRDGAIDYESRAALAPEVAAEPEPVIISKHDLPLLLRGLVSQTRLIADELDKITVTDELRRTVQREIAKVKGNVQDIENSAE